MSASTSLPRRHRTTAESLGAWRARSDRELLERIPEDRTEMSLQTLYRHYSHEFYGVAYRSLGDCGAADELVQDVFTSIWRHAESYDGRRGSVRTWVYRIARNATIDRRRRASVRPGLVASAEDKTSEAGTLDESIERIGQRWQVTAALARLIPEHRDAVCLASYEGMTRREIAEAKGVAVGTIKSRTWYSLRNLRVALEETDAP